MYSDSTQVITIPSGGTEDILLEESMSNINVTLGPSNITIDIAGDYRIEFFVLLQASAGVVSLTVEVEINGVFSEPSFITSTVLGNEFQSIH